MFARSNSDDTERHQRHIPSSKAVDVQPKLRPILISFAASVFLGLATLVLVVVAVARMGAIPRLLDLPQYYLPGNPLPWDVSCYTPGDRYLPSCLVHLLTHE